MFAARRATRTPHSSTVSATGKPSMPRPSISRLAGVGKLCLPASDGKLLQRLASKGQGFPQIVARQVWRQEKTYPFAHGIDSTTRRTKCLGCLDPNNTLFHNIPLECSMACRACKHFQEETMHIKIPSIGNKGGTKHKR